MALRCHTSSLVAGRKRRLAATSPGMTQRFFRCSILPMMTLSTGIAATGLKPETRNRAEISAQYKWDFTPIFPTWAAWSDAMNAMEEKMNAFAAMKGTLKNGPDAVLKAYKAFDEIGMMQY